MQGPFGSGRTVLMGSALAGVLEGEPRLFGAALFIRRMFRASPRNVTPIKSLSQHMLLVGHHFLI